MPWSNGIEERRELVRAMRRRREPVRRICERFGVSRALAYKLTQMCEDKGVGGLPPQRRGPKGWSSPKAKTYWRWLRALRRRRPTWSGWKLRRCLRVQYRRRPLPSARTIDRWLHTTGLVRSPRRRGRIKLPPLHAVKCARRSNDRWTFDWKGWSRTGDGRRFEPLTVQDQASRTILWAKPLPNRSDAVVRQVCGALFRAHGVPRRIRTDLGGPFCGTGPYGFTSLSLWWHTLGIEVEFVNRAARIHNNGHEHMHGVMEEETAKPPAATFRAQVLRVHAWRRVYNHERAHEALNGRTPAEVYRPSAGAMPKLRLPRYRPSWLVRRVAAAGTIWLGGHNYYIGRAFAGLFVGCKPTRDGHQAYYGKLSLKTLRPPLKPLL
jgi:transposase